MRRCEKCVHAWAAGLFDGEGCIGLYKVRGTWRMELRITLKARAPLVRMKRLYGGCLFPGTRSWGETYYIWVQSNPVTIVGMLEGWIPWLVEKKSQARVALEYCQFRSERRERKVYSRSDRARCERWERKLKSLKHGK